MSQAVPRTPRGLARRDLSARQAIVAACIAMAGVLCLDLMDGQLGMVFSVGFVLIVVTVPLAVDVRSLLPAGVLPPALLIGSLLVVCLVHPGAVEAAGLADDAGRIGRLIAGTIDRGITLVVGHAAAMVVIAVRIITDPER